jgi:hypothetical protein
MTNKAILNEMIKIQKQLNALADKIDATSTEREMLKSNLRYDANKLISVNSHYVTK